MNHLLRRRALLVAPAAAALAGPAAAQSEAALRVVVGYPPGATADALTRLLAEYLQRTLKQTVLVENKVGAGGRIANEQVKAAPADGTTLLLTPMATMAIFPHSYPGQLRYDPFKDFVPVAHLANVQIGFGVGTRVPAQTLKQYVAWVKADPANNGYYGSASAGSVPHFFGVMFGRAAGVELTHVPYKGTAPALNAVASGEISAISTVAADIKSLVSAGKARLLAVSGEQRDPGLPDVPTFREQGFDLVAKTWYGLFAPAGTPAPTVDRLAKAAVAAIHDPALRRRLLEIGMEPTGQGPDKLGAALKEEYERWRPAIKASGFKGD